MNKIVTKQTGSSPTLTLAVYAWLVIMLGALFYCYEYFLRIAPSVMEPQLLRAYHIKSAGMFGSSMAFYYYAYVPMQFFVGVLMDKYGPRRLLAAACFICALGAYLFAATRFLVLAELGRFLIGFGSAFAFVGAMKLATIWLPPNRFAMMAGLITSLGMIGAMVGQIALATFLHFEGWRLTTYLSSGLGLLLVLSIWFVVRDGQQTDNDAYSDTVSYRVLFSNLWVAICNKQMWFAGLIGGLLYLSLSMFAELWAVPYMEQARHMSALKAAPIASMVFLGWAIGGPLIGVLSDYVKRRKTPVVIGAAVSLVLALIIVYVPNIPVPLLYVLLVLFGMACSVECLAFVFGRELNSKKISGAAIALINMFVMLGGAIFQPLTGDILDWVWSGKMHNGVQVFTNANYEVALSILPLGLLVALILSLFLKETYCQSID